MTSLLSGRAASSALDRRAQPAARRTVRYVAPVGEDREERLAYNEVVFRALNEQIEAIAGRLGRDAAYEFICECATSGCFERVTLTVDEYERIRGEGSHFLVCPGHEDIEVEQVVARHAEYYVVQKDGVAGLIAADTDPRS